jgi:hypothetical protein
MCTLCYTPFPVKRLSIYCHSSRALCLSFLHITNCSAEGSYSTLPASLRLTNFKNLTKTALIDPVFVSPSITVILRLLRTRQHAATIARQPLPGTNQGMRELEVILSIYSLQVFSSRASVKEKMLQLLCICSDAVMRYRGECSLGCYAVPTAYCAHLMTLLMEIPGRVSPPDVMQCFENRNPNARRITI